jgi:arylsulfatase A-like enzyme
VPPASLSLLLVVAVGGCAAEPAVPSGAGLNVLLISIDTLRADHLGCYGYPRPTSPHLDAFAAEGVRFARAISQSPWTTPSHMTLFTSLHPSSHQLNQSYESFLRTARVLPEATVTLAEVLREHGYRTLALTGGGTVAGRLGFDQGFEEYLEGYYNLGNRVWNQLQTWLDAPREAPFFLFLHTFHVHAPYSSIELAQEHIDAETAQEMYRATLAAGSPLAGQRRFLAERGLLRPEVTKALYDGGIRETDAFLGRLFDELHRRGLDDETLIIVTSDHGEEFADHDPKKLYDAHGHSQHEELVHVPLLVQFPRYAAAGRVVNVPVGLIDVAPTILDLLGITVPSAMQGQSLATLWRTDRPVRSAVTSEATIDPRVEHKSLRTSRFSYLVSYRTGADGERTGLPGPFLRGKLFDLRADPRERIDLVAQRPRLAARMRRALEEHFAALQHGAPPEVMPIDEELEEALRTLGYLQ